MIFQLLGDGVFTIFTLLFSSVNFPSIDDNLLDNNIHPFMDMLSQGGALVGYFVPYRVVTIVINFSIALIFSEVIVYSLKWVLSKFIVTID